VWHIEYVEEELLRAALECWVAQQRFTCHLFKKTKAAALHFRL